MKERIRRILKARTVTVALIALMAVQVIIFYFVHQVLLEQQKTVDGIRVRLNDAYGNIVGLKIRLKAIEALQAKIK